MCVGQLLRIALQQVDSTRFRSCFWSSPFLWVLHKARHPNLCFWIWLTPHARYHNRCMYFSSDMSKKYSLVLLTPATNAAFYFPHSFVCSSVLVVDNLWNEQGSGIKGQSLQCRVGVFTLLHFVTVVTVFCLSLYICQTLAEIQWCVNIYFSFKYKLFFFSFFS